MSGAALASVLAGPIVQIIDELFDTPAEKANAKLKLLSIEMAPFLAQLEVNKEEAKHTSLFVAGWRPFIGWVCGAIFVWSFMLAPLLQWITQIYGVEIPEIPALGIAELMPVLLGLLGLGGMRTFEKYTGSEASR